MPYTNAWTETQPLGSQSAKLLDDDIRGLKVDIRERINSLLGLPLITTLSDPVVVEPDREFWVAGLAGNFYPNAGGSFILPNTPATIETGIVFNATSHVNGSWAMFNLAALPIGASIKSFAVTWKGASAADKLKAKLRKIAFTPAATTLGDSTTIDGTGAIITTTVTLGTPHVIATGFAYSIDVEPTLNGIFNLYGIKVTYTSPSFQVRR